MVFESKNNVYDEKNARYVSECGIDTETQTVRHYIVARETSNILNL